MLDGRAVKGIDSKLSNREVEGSSPMLRKGRHLGWDAWLQQFVGSSV